MSFAKHKKSATPTRRRLLKLVAASAGGLAFPHRLLAAPVTRHRWQGKALGAEASILLFHESGNEAQSLIAACVDEIDRLEAVFSLHRPDSALSRWNAHGELAAPPRDLVDLARAADEFRRATGGAFDITVQPLWSLLADHFASGGGGEGPGPDALAAALARVGGGDIEISPERVMFRRPQMAATFNGIAQGYITDRVTDLLKAAGMKSVLLDLGEYRAIGGRPSDEPWRIGIADARAPWRVVERLAIRDRAVATSSPWGTPFDDDARFNHLLDPRSGLSASEYLSVTVIADDAVTADALSTALSLVGTSEAKRIAKAFPNVEAVLRLKTGELLRVNA